MTEHNIVGVDPHRMTFTATAPSTIERSGDSARVGWEPELFAPVALAMTFLLQQAIILNKFIFELLGVYHELVR